MQDYLAPLLEDTPSAPLKLLAAWDGLTAEAQIEVLNTLTKRIWGVPRGIYLKAIESPNAYVRYLAARLAIPMADSEENRALLQRIEGDESPLVRYAPEEWRDSPSLTPEEFFGYPREKRLARLRGAAAPRPERFAEWITWAIDAKGASGDVLLEVVTEYIRNPHVLWLLTSPAFEYREGEDGSREDKKRQFEALWNLVPKVPAYVARWLVQHLPPHTHYEEVPEGVLQWLHGSYLVEFLGRADVDQFEFRRQVFYSEALQLGPGGENRYDRWEKSAAASHNFEIDGETLHKLFNKQPEMRKERLVMLAALASSEGTTLTLPVLKALGDYFSVVVSEMPYKDREHLMSQEGYTDHAKAAEATLKARVQKLRTDPDLAWQAAFEIRLLRTYELASAVVPWTREKIHPEELIDPLAFLKDWIKPGDTWGTYMAFSRGLGHHYDQGPEGPWREAEDDLEHWLPDLEDLDSPEEYRRRRRLRKEDRERHPRR